MLVWLWSSVLLRIMSDLSFVFIRNVVRTENPGVNFTQFTADGQFTCSVRIERTGSALAWRGVACMDKGNKEVLSGRPVCALLVATDTQYWMNTACWISIQYRRAEYSGTYTMNKGKKRVHNADVSRIVKTHKVIVILYSGTKRFDLGMRQMPQGLNLVPPQQCLLCNSFFYRLSFKELSFQLVLSLCNYRMPLLHKRSGRGKVILMPSLLTLRALAFFYTFVTGIQNHHSRLFYLSLTCIWLQTLSCSEGR